MTLRRVVLLAGGVGGARMAEGLKLVLPADSLTVIVNVGDDDMFHGLHVSPDIDTLIYTLSGRIDRAQGWGVASDATRALDVLRELGAPVWMKLGDADMGLHIWRTERLRTGIPLSELTLEAARLLGAGVRILPVTDDPVRTKLLTAEGWLDFQRWFVGERCVPPVREVAYQGASAARPAEGVLKAIAAADLIVVAPSNPILSISPILAVPGVREALEGSSRIRIGVSPLIGGSAVKGPLASMMGDLGFRSSAEEVAAMYEGIVDAFVVDTADGRDTDAIEAKGLSVLATDILMRNPLDARRLASEIITYCHELRA